MSAEDEQAPESVVVATGGLAWTRVQTPRLLSNVAKASYVGVNAVALVAAVVALALPGLAGAAMLSASWLVALVAYPLWIVSYVLSLTQTTFAGSLEISPTLLTVRSGGVARLIARRDVVGALVVERRVGEGVAQSVEIELAGGDRLTAWLPGAGAARAVVEKLGFGPGGRRLVSRLAKPTRRLRHLALATASWIVGVMVYVLLLALEAPDVLSLHLVASAVHPLVALGLYEVLRRATETSEVVVGAEGVIVRRGLRRTATDLRTYLTMLVSASGVDKERLLAVEGVMAERARPSAITVDRLAAYAREGRAMDAWRAALADAAGTSDYRALAVTPDEAASVLASLEATPEQRVGAALALRAAGAPPERIRVAAEGVADERLGDALEAVADGDDDRAGRVLQRLSLRR